MQFLCEAINTKFRPTTIAPIPLYSIYKTSFGNDQLKLEKKMKRRRMFVSLDG
jgi:hypothetical protein